MPLREVNGVRLDVEVSGSGEPLVLVHGSWDDRGVWTLVEEELARYFQVVSYARRGHTGSENGSGPGSRRQDEDDLAALLEDGGLAPAHLATNSFGSSIALGLISRRPELVRSLCAHEPPLLSLAMDDAIVPQVGERVGAVLSLIESGDNLEGARVFVEDVALGPGAWEVMPQEDRDIMVANAQTFLDEQQDPDWASIDVDALAAVPTHVMLTQGDQSPPFFAVIIARLAESLPNVQVKTLRGTGHVPHLTHPEIWVSAVREAAAGAR